MLVQPFICWLLKSFPTSRHTLPLFMCVSATNSHTEWVATSFLNYFECLIWWHQACKCVPYYTSIRNQVKDSCSHSLWMSFPTSNFLIHVFQTIYTWKKLWLTTFCWWIGLASKRWPYSRECFGILTSFQFWMSSQRAHNTIKGTSRCGNFSERCQCPINPNNNLSVKFSPFRVGYRLRSTLWSKFLNILHQLFKLFLMCRVNMLGSVFFRTQSLKSTLH